MNQEGEKRKESFNAREDISQANKDYVTAFFKGYNCADTSIVKFYSWLPYVLTQTNDIKQTMNNETELIDIFDKLHKKLGPSGYKTASDVTKTFCRELNKGKVPEAFERIKKLTTQEKEQFKRINKEGYYTLSWEDGQKITKETNSQQIKSMILTQLDSGMRPSELEGLNYGDVKRDGKFIILHISKSKTGGKRDIVIYRSAPMLNRWLQLHPTKEPSDPLWIMENKTKSSTYRANEKRVNENNNLSDEAKKELIKKLKVLTPRYKYHAIKQMFKRLGDRAGFKGVGLYMMRHSAVSLTKQEMMVVDIAAERYGHDINYYINTYGKLTEKQKIDRFKQHYDEAEEEEKEEQLKSILCNVCDTINTPLEYYKDKKGKEKEREREFCEKCNSPLSLKKALEIEKQKEDKLNVLESKMERFENALKYMEKYGGKV